MYIDLPDYCFAYNAKAGISSFARAIIRKYYSENEQYVSNLLSENIENHYKHFYFALVKKVEFAHKPVVLLVRDPVDRLLSAMCYVGIKDIDLTLNALENKEPIDTSTSSKPIVLYKDIHFRHQATYLSHDNYLFKFPEHIEEASKFIAVDDIMHLNKSRDAKPAINDDHKDRILRYFKRDAILFNSINKPGTRVVSKEYYVYTKNKRGYG